MGLPEDASLQEVLIEIQERIDAVGPLARVVLGSRAVYSDWRHTLQDAANVREFLDVQHRPASVDDLPGTSKYYIAPLSGQFERCEKFMVLGRLATQQILCEAKAKHLDKTTLRHHNLEGQLGEAVLLDHYLLGKRYPPNPCGGKPLPLAWDSGKWEFFQNPGADLALERKHALDRKTVKTLRAEHTQRTGVTYFLPSALPGSMQAMNPDSVYLSTVYTAAVAGAAIFSKNGALLTLFQIGARHLDNESRDDDEGFFCIDTLRRWVSDAKPKQLHVIHFTNWAWRNARGFGVDGYKDDDAISRELFDGQEGKFRSFIIRGGIYRDVPGVMLLGPRRNYSDLREEYATAEAGGQMVRVRDMRCAALAVDAVSFVSCALLRLTSTLTFAGPVRETAERIYEAAAGALGGGWRKDAARGRPQGCAGAKPALHAECAFVRCKRATARVCWCKACSPC
jgi:hypothetical protein